MVVRGVGLVYRWSGLSKPRGTCDATEHEPKYGIYSSSCMSYALRSGTGHHFPDSGSKLKLIAKVTVPVPSPSPASRTHQPFLSLLHHSLHCLDVRHRHRLRWPQGCLDSLLITPGGKRKPGTLTELLTCPIEKYGQP